MINRQQIPENANNVKTINLAKPVLLGVDVSTLAISTTTETFVVRDKFKLDNSQKAEVKISYIDENFEEWFLNKIESPFVGSAIYARKLEKNSTSKPIVEELGGKSKAETLLTELYYAMAAQPSGESGDLLSNGWENIFFIKDVNGILRAVSVRWLGGWELRAKSIEDKDNWFVGFFLIFSHKSFTY